MHKAGMAKIECFASDKILKTKEQMRDQRSLSLLRHHPHHGRLIVIIIVIVIIVIAYFFIWRITVTTGKELFACID
jgi:hypothetical protein